MTTFCFFPQRVKPAATSAGWARLPLELFDKMLAQRGKTQSQKRRQDAGTTIAFLLASILSLLMRHGRLDGLGGAENACAILFSRTKKHDGVRRWR
jgi:hypothetical protein